MRCARGANLRIVTGKAGPRVMATSGMLLILSGPSGVGKTTISRCVEKELGGFLSVSITTRPKTAADVEGVDYHFVDEKRFQELRDDGQLLEWAEVFRHHYGTPTEPVVKALTEGNLVILEIDVKGAAMVKLHMSDAYALFFMPPSEEALLSRLRSRQRESESAILRRFAKAKEEIARARSSGIYDGFIVNDDLDRAMWETARRVRDRWDELQQEG